MGHMPFARKRFGQNFLIDGGVIASIVDAIDPRPGELLVEIGPGHAALTAPVLERAGALTAIELDRDLCARLRSDPFLHDLTLIEADALKYDFTPLCARGPLRIFGNLPYNITTPLLLHLMNFSGISDLTFMLQREVVQRLAAPCGGSDYGRLSIIIQHFCEVEALFEVPPTAFRPRPEVTSQIVRLRPRDLKEADRAIIPALENVTRAAFSARRKTLRNALGTLFTAAELSDLGCDPTLRPENLSPEDYLRLARALSTQSR